MMSIIGPREPHDYRDCNLWVPGTNLIKPKNPEKEDGAPARLAQPHQTNPPQKSRWRSCAAGTISYI